AAGSIDDHVLAVEVEPHWRDVRLALARDEGEGRKGLLLALEQVGVGRGDCCWHPVPPRLGLSSKAILRSKGLAVKEFLSKGIAALCIMCMIRTRRRGQKETLNGCARSSPRKPGGGHLAGDRGHPGCGVPGPRRRADP